MLIRDTIHKFGSCGATIRLHGAIAVMTPEGVIDTEKSRPLQEGGPKPDPSNVAQELLSMPRYKRLETKKITSPKPAPKPPAKPPANFNKELETKPAITPPASAPPPASATGAPETVPPTGDGDPTSLPATPQSGDRETLDEVLLAKDSSDLKVHEVEAALDTNLVPLAKVEKWLKQEKKGKKRKTLINVLKAYIDQSGK